MTYSQNRSFDSQASSFDARAGLPVSVRRIIAHAVFELVETPSQSILEIGAGTGEIGAEFLRLSARYTGVDASKKMLEVFRQRVAPGGLNLVHADASVSWPVDNRSLSVVFGSRSLHLLDPGHVATECRRVLENAGVMLVGRVVRSPDSARAEMQRKMRELLRGRAMPTRSGEPDALVESCRNHGATPLAARTVAEWTVRSTPQSQITGWRSKSGLAGTSVSDAVKDDVLGELERWARGRWSDLNEPVDSVERYLLSGARFPA